MSESAPPLRHSSAAGILRRGLAQFAGFEVLFRLLGLAVFTPLTAWLAAHLLSWSGSKAVSNYDLAGFFLSFKGLTYVTVVVTISWALLFFEFGGLTALAVALSRREKVRLSLLCGFLALALPRLWRLSVRQFLTYLVIALPFLAVAGGAYLVFLTENDINYYLYAKPRPFWIALTICCAAGLGFAWVAGRRFIDWFHAVPLLLFTPVSPAGSLRESARLMRGRRTEVLRMLLGWLALTALLLGADWLLMHFLKSLLPDAAGRNPWLAITLSGLLAVVSVLLAALVTIVSLTILACQAAVHFSRLVPHAVLPESLAGENPALLRRAARLVRSAPVAVLMLAGLGILTAIVAANAIKLDDSVAVTAHRGSSLHAPENSMAAILRAVEEGADFVEIDVQQTKDGTVVLAHDKDLNRVFGLNKRIWEVTYDEIRDLDSGSWFGPEFSGLRIATLAQVIEAVKGRARLNIELKFNGPDKNLAAAVVRIVNEHGFAGECILTSLDYEGILLARRAGPGLRTGVIVTSAIGDITGLETDLLSVSAGAVTRDLIARAHRRGLEVHVWTVNDAARMNTLAGMGVDNIITDDPKLLRDTLAERAALSSAEKILLRLADLADGRH